MTTNAFIFAWDHYGIESIVPITKYENFDKEQVWNSLNGILPKANPIGHIIGSLKLRARLNSQRCYEIYAIDCDEYFDEEYWWDAWENEPQKCADIIREHGIKIHSDRSNTKDIVIK